MGKNVWLGAILCFVSAVSWGAMFPVAHAAFKHIDPFYFTIFRYGVVSILLVALLLWKEGIGAFRLEGRGLLLWFYGIMAFAVYNLLIFWGEEILGEQGIMVASIMESLMPMISILILWLFFHKRPYPFTSLCIMVSFIGAILVITKGDIRTFIDTTDYVIPSILILLAVIGWVIYTLGGKDFDTWSALRYSTLSCLLGTMTAIVIVIAATYFGFISLPTAEGIKAVNPHLLFMIIFPGLIALVGWNLGVGILSPVNALLFINFVPVTSLVISIFQGYRITSYDLIGTILIIFSLISNNIFIRLRQKYSKRHLITNIREFIS